MDPMSQAILIIHLVIMAVGLLAHRFTTRPSHGMLGIYFILLPVGFQVFGADLDRWMLPGLASAGVAIVLVSLRRPREAEAERATT